MRCPSHAFFCNRKACSEGPLRRTRANRMLGGPLPATLAIGDFLPSASDGRNTQRGRSTKGESTRCPRSYQLQNFGFTWKCGSCRFYRDGRTRPWIGQIWLEFLSNSTNLCPEEHRLGPEVSNVVPNSTLDQSRPDIGQLGPNLARCRPDLAPNRPQLARTWTGLARF